uniref:Uncharacterized protein n=1 Tax=Arundo donax TaxID=35708 RepID=A0A0A9GAB2_ARUDO
MVGACPSMFFFVDLLVLFIPWRPFRKSPMSIPSLHINSFYEFPKTVNVAATIGFSQSIFVLINIAKQSMHT